MNVEYLKFEDIDSYITLIKDVFDYDLDKKAIEKLIKKDIVLILKKDNDIIASINIEERFEYIKNMKYYFLSYLCVKKEDRRKGYATQLFDEVEKLANENNIKYLELTSGNQRKAAYYFYKNKNFKIKDTTVFVKMY